MDAALVRELLSSPQPDGAFVREIISKSVTNRQALEPRETAALLSVCDPQLLEEMFSAAAAVKKAVYDNRIVTFAPLYCSNLWRQ